MKIKVIDLLNKLANGEEMPNKIAYNGAILEYEEKYQDYFNYYGKYLFEYKFAYCNDFLSDEVEIIEEPKKIKKIDFGTLNTQKEKNRAMKDTINELIDEINNLKEK